MNAIRCIELISQGPRRQYKFEGSGDILSAEIVVDGQKDVFEVGKAYCIDEPAGGGVGASLIGSSSKGDEGAESEHEPKSESSSQW